MTKHKFSLGVLIFSLVFAMILFYSYIIEPQSLALHVSSPQIADLPNDWKNVKIAYLSDTSITDKNDMNILKKSIVDMNAQRPDIIFFSGTLLDPENINEQQDEQISTLLQQLQAPLGKFALTSYDKDAIETIIRSEAILENAQFSIVNNSSRKIYNHSLEALQLIAINEATSENEKKELLSTSQGVPSILITTQPNIYNQVPQYPTIHFTLSSGTYGGLIHLPILQQLFVKNEVSDFSKGYYNRNSSQILLVNSGVGTPEYFPFRLFNRPAVYLLSLQQQTSQSISPSINVSSDELNDRE